MALVTACSRKACWNIWTLIWEYRARAKWPFRPSWNGSSKGPTCQACPAFICRAAALKGSRFFVKQLDKFPLPTPDFLWPVAPSRSGILAAGPDQTRMPHELQLLFDGNLSKVAIFGNGSPEIVTQWLRQWAELGFRRFYFVDNTFNLPPSYAKELCSLLTTISPGISWRCILYPARLDEALISAMARAGCIEVSWALKAAPNWSSAA